METINIFVIVLPSGTGLDQLGQPGHVLSEISRTDPDSTLDPDELSILQWNLFKIDFTIRIYILIILHGLG